MLLDKFKKHFPGACHIWRFFSRERRCRACAALFTVGGQAAEDFCPECAALLGRLEKGYCPDCGEAAAWPELPLVPCARCAAAKPLWDTLFFHSLHEGLLRRLLIRLKFHGGLTLAPALAGLLARHPAFDALAPDAVIPIPLHESRLMQRGYNQALELAKALCAARGFACEPGLLRRVKKTRPQTDARRALRQEQLKGAFRASPAVQGRRILLLDDIITTGSTMREASAALFEAGAARVGVAAVSRTPQALKARNFL